MIEELGEIKTEHAPQKFKFSRDIIYIILIALLVAACGQFYYSYKYKPAAEREVKIYYNHDTKANIQVINTIQDADQFVYFAIYTFTREDIKDALLGAKHRGLKVEGVVDRKQTQEIASQRSIINELTKAGIPIAFNDHDYIMHAKAIVTDKSYVIGSYNWTAAATDNNDEVIEVGRDEALRKQWENTLKEIVDKYQKIGAGLAK